MEKILVVIVAMLPVLELRGAIPYGVLSGVDLREAFALAVLGNLLVVIPLFLFWEHATHRIASWHPLLQRVFHRVFERTRQKHGKKFERMKGFGLFLLVAIPLPGTGAWAGTLASYLFGVSFGVSVVSIGLGVIASGFLISLLIYLFGAFI